MVTKKDSSLLKKTQTPRSSEHLWIKKKLCWIACIIITVFAVYLAWDYRGPLEISLQPDNACGLPCLRAEDLLVQGHDTEGHLWATRGMVAYRLRKSDSKFVRQYHVPTGFSIFWLRNFSIVRQQFSF